jgi:hypothetical protein
MGMEQLQRETEARIRHFGESISVPFVVKI